MVIDKPPVLNVANLQTHFESDIFVSSQTSEDILEPFYDAGFAYTLATTTKLEKVKEKSLHPSIGQN